MAIITAPFEIPVQKDSWRLDSPAQVNRTWSGKRQVNLLPGALWSCNLVLAPRLMTGSAKAWRAFFASLNGLANQFKVYTEPTDQSTQTGAQVNGAGQTGSTLLVKGLTNTVGTAALVAGDWMTITMPNTGQQLTMVTSMTNTASGGLATATISPPLRESPANSAAIDIKRPYGIMSLKEPFVGWEREIMRVHSFVIGAEETW